MSVVAACLWLTISASPSNAQNATTARPYVITFGELFSPNGAEAIDDGSGSFRQPYISASADFGSIDGIKPQTFAVFADFAVPTSIMHHHYTANYFDGIAPGNTQTRSSTYGFGVSTHIVMVESNRAVRPYIGAGLGIFDTHMRVTEREQSIVGNGYTLPLTGSNYQTNSNVTRFGLKLNAGIETRSGFLFQLETLILHQRDDIALGFEGGPRDSKPDGTSYSVGYRF